MNRFPSILRCGCGMSDGGGGGGGAVDSVFGRTGVVVAVKTDYAGVGVDVGNHDVENVKNVLFNGKLIGGATGAVAVDFTLGPLYQHTITGNITFTYTLPANPSTFSQILIQSGAGGFTIGFPAAVRNRTALSNALAANAVTGTRSVVTFLWDGTDLYGSLPYLGGP